jgi:hypothetical protein
VTAASVSIAAIYYIITIKARRELRFLIENSGPHRPFFYWLLEATEGVEIVVAGNKKF